jgi:hypothetical protein
VASASAARWGGAGGLLAPPAPSLLPLLLVLVLARVSRVRSAMAMAETMSWTNAGPWSTLSM